MRQISRHAAFGLMALTAGIAVVGGEAAWRAARAQGIAGLDVRIVAVNVPGASAISQVGTFLNVPPPGACANPIPSKFPSYIQPGAVLDPKRILVGGRSNFGAPLASGGAQEGSLLSIDPSGPGVVAVPPTFARSGGQASALGGAVQMFSANSPQWLNGVNNPGANTAQYAGVSNPLGLSNNNAFGRVWPANAPFGDAGIGSSSIDDPTGLPLAGPPNNLIGGVYAGSLTNRNVVATRPQPQVIPGSLAAGAVGTALLGPSPDGSCKAVFVVVTADGAMVQEHTAKGLDGLAPAGTIQPLVGQSWGGSPKQDVEPRLGVIMNPYTQAPVLRQLFVTEPFQNTIAVVDLVTFGSAPNQVFGVGSISRIGSPWLNLPVDLAPVQRDSDNVNWASNTTLDQGSDFYVANRGDNTIVRMHQDGSVADARRIGVGKNWQLINNGARLNGIATSTDGATKVDFGNRLLRIPEGRMKGARPHLVPAPAFVFEILERRARERIHPEAVFPGHDGIPLKRPRFFLTDRARAMAEEFGLTTAHGWRSTFVGWCEAIGGVKYSLREKSLAHLVGTTTGRSYDRDSVPELRRPVMERYCYWLLGEISAGAAGADVIDIADRRPARA